MEKFTQHLLIAKPKDVKTDLKFLGHQAPLAGHPLTCTAHQPSWPPPSPAPPFHWLGPLNSLVFVAWKPFLPPSGLLKLLLLEFCPRPYISQTFLQLTKEWFLWKCKAVHLTPPSGKVYWSPIASGKQNFSPSGLTNFPSDLLLLFSLTNSLTVCLQRSTIPLAFSNLITHGWANYIVHLHGYIRNFFFLTVSFLF